MGVWVAPLRIALIAAIFAAFSWFQFVNLASAREVTSNAIDLFDPRPARDILFIGTSRMSRNDMPSMVRAVADSAGSPVKYRVRKWTVNGASFRDHAGMPIVQKLIGQRWDRVILQGESSAQAEDKWRADFAHYGDWLIARTRRSGSPASLIVNWNYGEEVFRGYGEGVRADYDRTIQHDYRALAEHSGAGLIDVGTIWKRVEAAHPEMRLTTDGNHPSVLGTYICALMIYSDLSGADVRQVRYVPEGMTEAEASALRDMVADFAVSSIDARQDRTVRR
ncbi:MAG: DUF4886 domain-containing protein [Allosphingosinicella sp.]